jgi:hypothetical protein
VIASYIEEWGFKSDPEWTYPAYYEDYLTALHSLAAKVPLLVIGELPVWRPLLPEVILKELNRGSEIGSLPAYSFDGIDMDVFKTDARVALDLKQLAIPYVSMVHHLCDEQGCLRYAVSQRGPQLMSADYGHLSLSASQFVSDDVVGPALLDLLSNTSKMARAASS